MRFALVIASALLAASCAGEEESPLLKPGTYFARERGALCISGDTARQRAEFIAFGPTGDTNCAAQGRIERRADGWVLVPKGEGACRIPLFEEGGSLRFGAVPAACSYYCGPAAGFSGQSFTWTDTRDMMLVPDPLGHGGVC